MGSHAPELSTVMLSIREADTTVRTIVLTSVGLSPFCAGADLNELAKMATAGSYRTGWLKDVETSFSTFRKPIVAAVRGFAFAGGFEIALMESSADARFAFPEIKLGTIPGAGGTQRLTQALGKHKAMELILTGTSMTATELERYGIVNRVVSVEQDVVDEALKMAETVAAFSAPAIGLAKQAIRAAEATALNAGLEMERALYYSAFSLADFGEGVAAFLQKRPAAFEHR
ncbi:enoyl-CoA hydratase [Trematosphaeria pertusa]|uniref:Enoyl-CoA hydratase n=1 Tax=Trematosphaeria pertusa TaxID=390896 RepID=A0A6A6IY24_9PLEO|nr:enoyl-CoA hydratase [Trematosphaeria pertusa]KAF2255208.1 enoyl-CoA hydratase [Trematosphaeria pertusa]